MKITKDKCSLPLAINNSGTQHFFYNVLHKPRKHTSGDVIATNKFEMVEKAVCSDRTRRHSDRENRDEY